MKFPLKTILFGALVWLIPFVFAFPFYSKEGVPTIDIFFLKSMLIVVGTLSGAFFLTLIFKKLDGNYLREGIVIGIVWLVLNWVLDFFILLPLSQLSFGDYMTQIGIRYLNMPVISIMLGLTLHSKSK